jgi:hypothetical protein
MARKTLPSVGRIKNSVGLDSIYGNSGYISYGPVLRNHFWYRTSESRPTDPSLWQMDLDPATDPVIFLIDVQDANKKLIFLYSFSDYYFLKVHLHNFSKIKSQKEVTKQ